MLMQVKEMEVVSCFSPGLGQNLLSLAISHIQQQVKVAANGKNFRIGTECI